MPSSPEIESRMNLMFDTNIFNAILDDEIDVEKISEHHILFATHVQEDEINATKKPVGRKDALAKIFRLAITEVTATASCISGVSRSGKARLSGGQIPTESFVLGESRIGEARLGGGKIPTESFVWDTSSWDAAKWSDVSLVTIIASKLKDLNGGARGNIKDALIAETAIKNGHILITHDSDLASVVSYMGGRVADLEWVLNSIT